MVKPMPVLEMEKPEVEQEESEIGEELFAVGLNEVDMGIDCGTTACPAIAAGYFPGSGDGSATVASVYDRILLDKFESGEIEFEWGGDGREGAVREGQAKEAWLEAIQHTKDRGRYVNVIPSEKNIEVAEDIARELGWM